jgi:outer membrane protein OmpU
MNKLTKIGVSALCGSLAAISAAKAGDLSVTGGVDMSWQSLDDAVTGNPIGIGSNLTFSGSGELDNGWSVALSVAHANGNAYSNTNVVVGVPSIGDIRIDQGTSGTGIDRMDDLTPTVWEEAYGTGLTSGIINAAGGSAGSTIEITPSAMTPDGVTVRVAYTPDAGGSNAGDKAGSGTSTSVANSAWDVTATLSSEVTGVDGLTLYGGIAEVTQDTTNSTTDDDKTEEVLGFTYAMNNWTFGYQWSEVDLGKSSGATKYDNAGYGITFNVNDDLSIGYNYYESEQSNTTNNKLEATSLQVAYTMGGASIRLAEAEVDNASYSTAAGNDIKATTLSVSLAF